MFAYFFVSFVYLWYVCQQIIFAIHCYLQSMLVSLTVSCTCILYYACSKIVISINNHSVCKCVQLNHELTACLQQDYLFNKLLIAEIAYIFHVLLICVQKGYLHNKTLMAVCLIPSCTCNVCVVSLSLNLQVCVTFSYICIMCVVRIPFW